MTCPLSCLYRALLPCLLSCPPVVPSLHAPCHAPLSCPPSCHAPDVRSPSCVPAVPSLLPCPCRTFPVVHSFVRSCRARSLRNEIHWSALSCTTAVPVLTFQLLRYKTTRQVQGVGVIPSHRIEAQAHECVPEFFIPNLLPLDGHRRGSASRQNANHQR